MRLLKKGTESRPLQEHNQESLQLTKESKVVRITSTTSPSLALFLFIHYTIAPKLIQCRKNYNPRLL